MFRLASFVALLSLSLPASAADNDALSRALRDKAPTIIAQLKKKGYQNVGVLKFLVRKGDEAPQDDVGELNLTLANKVEVALILANTDENFGIISQASQAVVDQNMAAANHKDEAGRKAFFRRQFALAWSNEKVDPSGFITGVATLSTDLKKMTVRMQMFDKTGVLTDIPDDIVVVPDVATIAEANMSFALSQTRLKALVAGDPLPKADEHRQEAIEEANKAAAKKTDDEPFAPLTQSPVKWTVLYNGKAATVKGNRVPEPKESDKVEFLLENPGPGTYAVVLLVNGENTLYREKGSVDGCRKWVLTPNTSVTVRGFQVDRDHVAPFKVLSPKESDEEAVNYGVHAGTFRMVVYHGNISEKASAPEVPVDSDTTIVAIARTRGNTAPNEQKPQSLKSLQADLRGRLTKDHVSTRGLVVTGDKIDRLETESVQFVRSLPAPVADISLRYHTPAR